MSIINLANLLEIPSFNGGSNTDIYLKSISNININNQEQVKKISGNKNKKSQLVIKQIKPYPDDKYKKLQNINEQIVELMKLEPILPSITPILNNKWILSQIIEDNKCTKCYQPNFSKLITKKKEIDNTINNNYNNYLHIRSDTSVKNIEHDFNDDENI
jgi:hypothetical protein